MCLQYIALLNFFNLRNEQIMIRILWLRTFDLIVTDLKWNNLWYEIRIWWWSFWSVLSGFGLATVVSQFCSANIWCWSPHLWQILCLKSCELYPMSMYANLQIVHIFVKEKGMAGNQVKKFQQLQEQRTQAFHELGIKASSKKFQYIFWRFIGSIPNRSTSQDLPLPCSKIWGGFWRIQEGGQVHAYLTQVSFFLQN